VWLFPEGISKQTPGRVRLIQAGWVMIKQPEYGVNTGMDESSGIALPDKSRY
jgi:hypothetical protein